MNSFQFWSKVNRTEGCWLWAGSKRSEMGYGSFVVRGRSFAAHRVSWELTHGPIPPGLKVLHKCDVPACVNPDHLFLGTDKDNHQDKAAKGRHWQQKKTHCPQGHPYDLENTEYPAGGGRKCKACRRASSLARKKSQSVREVSDRKAGEL